MAELGDVIEMHLKQIGLLEERGLDPHQQAHIEETRAKYEIGQDDEDSEDFPDSASLGMKCQTKAVVQLDGCMTCLSCGDSKCS